MITKRTRTAAIATATLLAGFGLANADYETHPDLRPEHRCGGVPSIVGNGAAPAIPPEWRTNEGQTVYGPESGPFETSRGEPALNGDGSAVTAADIDVQTDPGGADSLHCQKLFWDVPSPSELGALVIAAPYAEDEVPRWPNGLTDRLPPLYVDGGEGFEKPCPGGESVGTDGLCPGGAAPRARLCPDPTTVPWWAPVFAEDGSHPEGVNEPIIASFDELQAIADAHGAAKPSYVFLPAGVDTNGDGRLNAVGSQDAPQSGEVFRLECRRGVRTHYGPWQTGTKPDAYDALFEGTTTRMDTTPLLDADVAGGNLCVGDGPEDTCTCVSDPASSGAHNPIDVDGLACQVAGAAEGDTVPATGRIEWNTGSDFYNHFASHHGTCWNPETDLTSGALEPSYQCNDPEDPWAASQYEEGGECHDYHQTAEHRYDHPNCQADPDCMGSLSGQMFRNATQYPGRLYVEIPEERGVISLEKQSWRCDHHVVLQLPPGSYSMTKLANYRLQKGGIMNPRVEGVNCGMAENDPSTPIDETRSCQIRIGAVGTLDAGSGEYLGGSVGEMVIQYFTDPFNDESVKPVNVQFEVIQDAATTWYPPFTFHAHKVTWWAPFDLAIGLITTHSHHRNSLGYMDISPANPVRLGGRDNTCGGAANGEVPPHVFTNTEWEDANLCEYWKEPDGPLVMRKGQTIQTTCYVNHGITPEAIKQGLVAGDLVEAFRVYNEQESGDPVIPRNDLETVPTSTWADAFVNSPIGREFLYGSHPALNYRVAYKCSDNPVFNAVIPVVGNKDVCNPNPAVDPDGDYVDGPYLNEAQCGAGGWCIPSPIIFANVGEDEMCIPVFMYWRLDNLLGDENGNPGLNQEAMDRLTGEAQHSIEAGDPSFFLEAVDQTGTPGVVQKWAGDIGDCRECKAYGW